MLPDLGPLTKNDRNFNPGTFARSLAGISFALTVALLLVLPAKAAEFRRYDQLDTEELRKLATLEEQYFREVRAEALTLMPVGFDTHTILTTLTPQVRIIRQRKRGLLNGIVRYLYSLELESEFVESYTSRLRDDVVDFALDGLLKKAGGSTRR